MWVFEVEWGGLVIVKCNLMLWLELNGCYVEV